jgi:hypothetical protein
MLLDGVMESFLLNVLWMVLSLLAWQFKKYVMFDRRSYAGRLCINLIKGPHAGTILPHGSSASAAFGTRLVDTISCVRPSGNKTSK